jgi:hypothetical protein
VQSLTEALAWLNENEVPFDMAYPSGTLWDDEIPF